MIFIRDLWSWGQRRLPKPACLYMHTLDMCTKVHDHTCIITPT